MSSQQKVRELPVVRYRLAFRVTRTIHAPEYAGSMLRGAFGHALRALVCVTGQPQCGGCAVRRTCTYASVFEPMPPETSRHGQQFSAIPAAFVVEPPDWGCRDYGPGESMVFSFILMGDALSQLPTLLLAWRHAFARDVGRGAGVLEHVWKVNGPVPAEGDPQPAQLESVLAADAQGAGAVRPHTQTLTVPPVSGDRLNGVVRYTTPLRVQDHGQILGVGDMKTDRMLMTLVRRCGLVLDFHLGRSIHLDFAAFRQQSTEIGATAELQFRDWTRLSNRQQRTMQLGGVVGTWRLRGVPAQWQPLLYLGQWLHVGKNASFGLGRYDVLWA